MTTTETGIVEPCPFCGEIPRLWKESRVVCHSVSDCPIDARNYNLEQWNTRAIAAMPETGIVEKVARAIALSDWPGNEWNIECFSEGEQNEYRSRARAAIAAMPDTQLLQTMASALEPFADLAREWETVPDKTPVAMCSDPQVDLAWTNIKAGDLRNAATALAQYREQRT